MNELYDYQLEALYRLKSGSILCGGVGSGKSLTGIAWAYFNMFGIEYCYSRQAEKEIYDGSTLYIITTAKKRDSREWQSDLNKWFGCFEEEWPIKVVIDSWNNIKKYIGVKNAYFLLDEQRLVGYGQWVKSFLKIARGNKWILLTATPGDTWMEYLPVMIANGYFVNKTDFICRHVVYNRFTNFPLIERYVNVGRLEEIRNDILVKMDFERETRPFEMRISCMYDKELYNKVAVDRWDPFNNWPVENVSQYCSLLHYICNSDPDRIRKVRDEYKNLPLKRVIIFYNYNYELDILRHWLIEENIPYSEWNGQKHEDIRKDSEEWVYLVQYSAGSEGWNCIDTNVIFFYSLNYSYKVMTQAKGRIDRCNTSFKDMKYYIFVTDSSIDKRIEKCLRMKKNFNEKEFGYGKR